MAVHRGHSGIFAFFSVCKSFVGSIALGSSRKYRTQARSASSSGVYMGGFSKQSKNRAGAVRSDFIDKVDKIAKQAVEIDSLKKLVRETEANNQEMTTGFQKTLNALQEEIKTLQKDSADVKKVKQEQQNFQQQVQTKSDSIATLKSKLTDKDRQIQEEYEKGKQSALADIVSAYKRTRFDELVTSSSKQSVQRDLRIVGTNPEIKQTLVDLDNYFNAKDLLEKKFDDYGIKSAQTKLQAIQQESKLLDKLKINVENYQLFYNGLRETVEKIITLDKNETVAGMDDEIQKLKFNKILTELSSYIFNYDFNFSDYPYLSDIVLEIIKRKQPDADADITDLKDKLTIK
jgi:chromosome segregation ATPase